MKLGEMSFFQLASQRMSWLGTRQSVISQNIANADTANYKAKEISAFDEMVQKNAPRQGLAVTSAQHITGDQATPEGVRVDIDRDAPESSISGNTVQLEQQTMAAADVAGSYRLAAELYRKGHALLTIAATGTR
ncbi:flagellar basal body rod protein FlgB [Sagittula salina]|uniref:Flagellar biosynthesis protein FlgB n=1 Tax=Sagittula salina TaxID=2820268 RepID=A0A940S2Y4_9RHOB|nr:flagellar basal body protein [Sagittula salina]MBP0484562.1 flagellar biosynthesis protein FlgB [Sagittula salina]